MKMLSLFSGIGGIDLAAQWAGIETVAFCERDKFCQIVLAKHWPGVPIFDDIKTLTKEVLENAGIGRIDIVAGGFPCQPFSLAGKRGGKQDSRHLWPEMRRIIHEIRPAWVIGENVPGLVSMGLEQVLVDLENEGYEAQTFNIPACAVNAPHKRARIFIVAYTSIEREGRLSIRQGRPFETSFDTDRSSENVPYADGSRCEECDITAESNQSRFGSGCCDERDVPNTSCELLYRRWEKRRWNPKLTNGDNVSITGCQREIERRNGRFSEVAENERNRTDNGGRTPGYVGGEWWDVEPGICRVANGIPNRTHRLRALGNAVVPQQIYPIFKAIMEIEKC
jgi:DNA (cytosine-5)-methyltransferase 1